MRPGGRSAGALVQDLPDRFCARWSVKGWGAGGGPTIVALSGGVDSLVLLHLLRFHPPDPALRLEAAHFDHRMRAGSEREGERLQGLCGAWGIPLHRGAPPPSQDGTVATSEAEARALRYTFLDELLRGRPGSRVCTAHHRDDQVETILFRILRGTGLEGLRGIPEEREPGFLRPLLSVDRPEIEAYAASVHLRPLEDSTNRSPRFARNRIRRTLLPELLAIHPGGGEGLLRLSRTAEGAVEALDLLLAPRFEALCRGRPALDRCTLDREGFLAEPTVLQGLHLRRGFARIGGRIGESGTERGVEFIRGDGPGRAIELPGGLRIERSPRRIVLRRVARNVRGVGAGTPQGGAGDALSGGHL